jgi:hypothetical protein
VALGRVTVVLSLVMSGHQWPLVAISGSQWLSVALSSVAFSGNQWQAAHLLIQKVARVRELRHARAEQMQPS